MRRFLVEREIPGIGGSTAEEVRDGDRAAGILVADIWEFARGETPPHAPTTGTCMESPEASRTRRSGTSRPVRVLFVNDHLGFPGGVTHGSTTYLSTVLPAFDRARIDARLCILRDRHPAAERFEAADVPLVFLARSKWDPRALADLIALIRRWECDIVHLNGQKSHLLGRVAARVLDRKAIIHLHMLYEPRPRFIQPWLARGTARALGVSEPLRRCAVDAFAMPPERTETLHNGIRLERFEAVGAASRERIRRELGIGPSDPVVGVVGRITTTPDKGQRLAIEAMAAVREEHPAAVMLVVGDGPARAACEARARELGLTVGSNAAASPRGGAIRFLGYRTDIPDLHAAMDVVAVPSVVDEALAYAALEGIAAGRPVVAFRGGGMPEIVLDGETGLLVDNADVDGLARALGRLLADPGRRERMGAAGRRHAVGFAFERHVARLDALYRELAG